MDDSRRELAASRYELGSEQMQDAREYARELRLGDAPLTTHVALSELIYEPQSQHLTIALGRRQR
jgi:hypothetical protein